MKLKQAIDAFQHKITESSTFLWDVFGQYARALSFGESSNKFASCSGCIVYDTQTLEVYVAEVWPGGNSLKRPYRWINPSYLNAYKNEHDDRGLEFDVALDTTKFIDLDEVEDFIEKATAMFNGQEFDERVLVKLHDFPDELFMQLAKQAHKEDLTINQMAEKILQSYIDAHED